MGAEQVPSWVGTVGQGIGFVVTAFAVWKTHMEVFLTKRPRMRDEYKFVKDSIDEVKDSTHPYLVEKWGLAAFGIEKLNHEEIVAILTFKNPTKTIKDYTYSHSYLKIEKGTLANTFSIKLRDKVKPVRVIWLNITGYVVFFAIAFSPIILLNYFRFNTSQLIYMFLFILLPFSCLAYLCLNEYGKALTAQRLKDLTN
jgi:hypothetical protein